MTRNLSSLINLCTCAGSAFDKCDLDFWPIDLRINTCQGPAIQYICTKLVLRAFLVEHTQTHAKISLITSPAHRLLLAMVIRNSQLMWFRYTTYMHTHTCIDIHIDASYPSRLTGVAISRLSPCSREWLALHFLMSTRELLAG